MLAAADQVVFPALVPPLILKVILDAPFVSRLTRMFSIDCAVRAQLDQARLNALEISVPVVSNMLAGKLVRLLQLYQVYLKLVPAAVSINGKLVRLEQSLQALPKLVPDEVSINGKLVRLLQFLQALPKLVPDEVSINGKLVRLLHVRQELLKLVTPLVTPNGHTNEVMLLAPYQAFARLPVKSAPAPITTDVI